MSFSVDELNADFYDLRKVIKHGGSVGITLPAKQCKQYGITENMAMRVIMKEGVFVVLKETNYQRFPKLREKIEELFQNKPVSI